MTENNLLAKKQSHAFNKDVYLLGEDVNGQWYWLEAPSWDCGWYWGFGYIETYKNNKHPDKSGDITSHSDARKFNKYFIEWNGSKPILTRKTFTEQEGWELSELFEQFYHLRDAAEFWRHGKSRVAETQIQNWKDEAMELKINKEMIPVITARILEILKP